jgi:diguanylate cyclase (GGDEF)-like protein
MQQQDAASSEANSKTSVAISSPTPIQFSIGWHLAIAFGAVAMLAILANVIVVHGESIAKTITVSWPSSNVEKSSAATAARIESLQTALDKFGRAVRARMQSNQPEATLLVSQTQRRLTQQLAAYVMPGEQDSSAKQFEVAAYQLKRHGEELIGLSDNRRQVLSEYSTHFEAMNAQMKHSIDGALKLFGRVIARQSLIDLHNQLDEVRRRFLDLEKSAPNDPVVINALTVAEQTFSESFQKNKKSLTRSEGATWIATIEDNFSRMLALPAQLTDIKHRLEKAEASFNRLESATYDLLGAKQKHWVTPREIIVPALPAPSTQFAPTNNFVVATQQANAGAFGTALTAPPAGTITTTQNTHDHRVLVAWVSGVTVLLVLLICVYTVRSVAMPVRGLLRGINKVAAGQALPPLPRGTIAELNNLVNAFGAMSGELSIARESMLNSQQQLELKVTQRTLELQRLAEHDPLTSLPNRRQLFSLLEASIANAEKQQHLVGIYFLDIDNFKNINDSMDHTYGDRVLKEIAHRLHEAIGAVGFAARLGGDEFAFVLTHASQPQEIAAFGQHVIQSFSHAIKIDRRELIVSVSIGASIYPEHGLVPEALLKAADAAAYRAKALGRRQLLMFTPDLLEVAAKRFAIEQGLRRALHNNEFELVFQPEINTATLEVDLVEALIRWRMPDGRLAVPDEFLAVAEESGLIMDISDWVLRTAIETVAQWHHGAWPAARVAINISPRHLMDDRFVEQVEGLLSEYRLPPSCIEIELTENVLQTGLATLNALQRLRNLGVAIALDDFGSGYSSLSSLEKLPLTRIKLDRGLIASIDTNARSWAIARAIVGLCHGLGIQLTAEGIERTEQFSMLASCRGMHLQGYLLSKPLHRDQVITELSNVASSAQAHYLAMSSSTGSSNVVDIPASPSRSTARGQRV